MTSQLSSDNPFARPSTMPFGLPDFAAIRVEHYRPAILAGIVEAEAEIAAITANDQAPTIENTLNAFEASGALLDRVLNVFQNLASADATEQIQEIDEETAPLIAAHHDAVYLNRDLFDRLDTLYEHRAEFDEETAWVLAQHHRDFVAAGVRLSPPEHDRLRVINERLTVLETEFDNRLLADTNDSAVHVEDPAVLAGFSDGEIAGAAQAARDRGIDGYLIELKLFTQQPATASLVDRQLRRDVQSASDSRCAHGNSHDTRATILEVVALRAERSRMLGYDHYAAYAAAEGTAATTDAVMSMLTTLAPAAMSNARREATVLQSLLDVDDPSAELAPSDWAYYAERGRKEEFDIDDATLRPYFELDSVVRRGVFYAAERLYGITFVDRPDLRGYHDDVLVFEVRNDDGSPIGLFLGDYYTRPTKRGGAWMNNLVDQSSLLGHYPVVCNNLNIVKPPSGTPTLLTFDEVETLFHEFGHAIHGLFSDVTYPSASGTNVPRDFVEFPSQVNEMWMLDPEVLANYARHVDTGEPIPSAYVEALTKSRSYNQGFATTEYLGAALLDQAWHQLDHDGATSINDVIDFEDAALRSFDLDPSLIPPRYRSTYFQHIFSGGYAAGYYGYIWSEVLDADTVDWFERNGGLTRANGDRFRSMLLAPGGSRDPMLMVTELLGRAPDITPLLVRRGLANAR